MTKKPQFAAAEPPPLSTGRPLGASPSQLARGSVLYAIANTGDKLVSFFVLIPLYARYLSPAAYGLIALSDSIAQLIVRVFGFSLDDGLRRLYFQYIDQPAKLKSFVSTVLWTALGTVGLMLLLAFTIVPHVIARLAPGFDVPFYPYIGLSIGGAVGLYVVLFRQTLYQVQSAPAKYLALSGISFLFTVTGAVTLVVLLHRGAYGMLLGKLLAALGAAVVSLFLMRHWLTAEWRWEHLHETLLLSLPLIPHYLTNYGLDLADRFILARYRPLAEVGLYSLAYTFGKSMYIVGLSVHQAWAPTFFSIARHGSSGNARLGRMASMIAIMLTWVALTGTLMAQVFIVRVLDVRYHPAARVVPWIIASFLFQAIYALSMLSAMQAKRTIFLFASSASAFTVNLALNFLLVPRYGMYGSAYANLAAFLVIAITMYFFGQRLFHVPYRTMRVLGAFAVYFLSLAVTQWEFPWPRMLVNLFAFFVGTVLLYLLSGATVAAIKETLRRKERVLGEIGS